MYLCKSKSSATITAVIFCAILVVFIAVILYCTLGGSRSHPGNLTPMVINTWDFQDATAKAWEFLKNNKTAIDAVEAGCTVCEMEQCKKTVGFGGSPDESGKTTLDAMIIDGATMNMGAVGCITAVKNAVSVARRVLENTEHTLIVGDFASDFAYDMDFVPESLSTNYSTGLWTDWKNNNCQPNFWTNVVPDHTTSCGPYKRIEETSENSKKVEKDELSDKNHDTITMLAIDKNGNVAAGATTNGLIHKIKGRVGDTPIPGAGAYADNKVGAASGTGNGDIMMRFLPSFLAVEEMRRGATPEEAAKTAIKRIAEHYPKFFGAIIAINIYGEFGAACNGMDSFPFCVANPQLGIVTNFTISCT